MRFRDMLAGDFPAEYKKIYFERAKKHLNDVKIVVNIIDDRPHWFEDATLIEISWTAKRHFFEYFDLLDEEQQAMLMESVRPLIEKIDKDLSKKLLDFDISKKFDIRVDSSLEFALTTLKFVPRFADILSQMVGKRYHYLNSREYLKANINKSEWKQGENQRDAMRQHAKDVEQVLNIIAKVQRLKEITN